MTLLNSSTNMLNIGNEYENPNCAQDQEQITKENHTDLNPLGPNHIILCRRCRLPQTDSNEVRSIGLRGCKCDELCPYYNSKPDGTNWKRTELVPLCLEKLPCTEYSEKKVADNLASRKNETCSVEASTLEKNKFAPPQGMNTGEYPRKLFHQYYPNQSEDYTFDLLPLPSEDRWKYLEMRTQSLDNKDIQEEWKDFLNNLPNSELQSISYPDDRFWRWKKYLRYAPNDNENEVRKKMQVGPKYDSVGRLPITGEELQTFRAIKLKPNSGSKNILNKGNRLRKKCVLENDFKKIV